MTDHSHAEKKYITHTDSEDEEHLAYLQNVQAYNDTSDKASLLSFTAARSVYPRGSMLQRIFEPLAFAHKNAEGTLEVEVTAEDVAHLELGNDARYEELFRKYAENREEYDKDELEEADRLAALERLYSKTSDYDKDQMAKLLDKELGVFKKGEPYNYSKDLKEAFRRSLRTSTEQKIFETIPDHTFWDIKKPLQQGVKAEFNRYNPFRGKEHKDYFEMVEFEEYIEEQHMHKNLNNGASTYHRRY